MTPLRAALLFLALAVAGCPSGGPLVDDDDATTDDDDATLGDDDDSAGDDDDSAGDDDDSAGDDDDSAGDDDDAAGDDDDSAGDDDDSAGDDDDSAGDDDDSAGDDDDSAGGLVFDCATAPSASPGETVIPGARGRHGLAIDDVGVIHGSDGNSLVRSTYSGTWSVFVPNFGGSEQMTFLPGGDLAVATFNGVTLVTPAGGQLPLVSGLSFYGLVYGPDGMLYAAGSPGIYRIDPTTGAATFLFNITGATPHSLGFSEDFARLYVGVIGVNSLFAVDLDSSLNPLGAPYVFATGVGPGSAWHDGVAVDVCGNIYVPDFWSSNLYRITSAGVVSVYKDWANTAGYGHGATWGTGVGGWDEWSIYVPLPYSGNTVKEVEIGVPGAGWSGTVLNGP